METKQTAMQELLIEVEFMLFKTLMGDQNKDSVIGYQMASSWIRKKIIELLIKEKEQIMDAFDEGKSEFIFNGTSEQYYNETYGNNTQKDNSEN